MMLRAKKGFGMDSKKNISIAEEIGNSEQLTLWKWIDRLKDLNVINGRNNIAEYEYQGIISALELEETNQSDSFRKGITKTDNGKFTENTKQTTVSFFYF